MPIVGEYFRRFGGGPQYSPTFMRGGNAAVFAFEGLAVDPGVTMSIDIEHKNEDDTSWGLLVNIGGVSTGISSVNAGPIKEMLRFAYTVSGTSPEDSVYLNTLAPAWRPY